MAHHRSVVGLHIVHASGLFPREVKLCVGNSAFIAVHSHPPNCGIWAPFVAASNTFIVLIMLEQPSPYTPVSQGLSKPNPNSKSIFKYKLYFNFFLLIIFLN